MIYIIIIFFVTILDQYSKHLAYTKLSIIETVPIINDVFHLTYRQNTGAAFSIFREHQSMLIWITLAVIIFMVFLLAKLINEKTSRIILIGISMIMGGAIGNLIDRFRLGYVVDFFDFRLINFAVFNIADSCIVVGALLIAAFTIYIEVKNRHE